MLYFIAYLGFLVLLLVFVAGAKQASYTTKEIAADYEEQFAALKDAK